MILNGVQTYAITTIPNVDKQLRSTNDARYQMEFKDGRFEFIKGRRVKFSERIEDLEQ